MNPRMIRLMVHRDPPRPHPLESPKLMTMVVLVFLCAMAVMVFRLYEFAAYLAQAGGV